MPRFLPELPPVSTRPSSSVTVVKTTSARVSRDIAAKLTPGVTKAVENVNSIIAPALIDSKIPVTSQKEIDDLLIKLDGTHNKGKLGANAILGVSMAISQAGAADKVCSCLCQTRRADLRVSHFTSTLPSSLVLSPLTSSRAPPSTSSTVVNTPVTLSLSRSS